MREIAAMAAREIDKCEFGSVLREDLSSPAEGGTARTDVYSRNREAVQVALRSRALARNPEHGRDGDCVGLGKLRDPVFDELTPATASSLGATG